MWALYSGPALAALFGGVFLWRAFLAFPVEEKRYLVAVLLIMAMASLVTLASAYRALLSKSNKH